MRQIEIDPTLVGDDDTDMMIPVAPATKAMSELMNNYVGQTLDTFAKIIVKRVIISAVTLFTVVVIFCIISLFTEAWLSFFFAVTAFVGYVGGVVPILSATRLRPNPVEVGHIKMSQDKASLN